ncbi:hypothetical protein FQR65_LT04597 [Abscondita terminalis]|nr:hypothetical protein FQR65_LT04597 [Abscondita terminalis]
MKVIVIFGCLITFSASASYANQNILNQKYLQKFQEREDLDEIIENAINYLVGILKNFDPIDIPEYVVNIFEYNVVFKNIHVEGFSGIVPNVNVSIEILQTALNLSLSVTNLSASIESWESNFPLLFGKGEARVDIQDLKIYLHVLYKLFGGLSPSEFITSIEEANAWVTGVNNNEELSQQISNLLNYILNTFMNSKEFHDMLGPLLDTVLQNIIDLIFGNLSK